MTWTLLKRIASITPVSRTGGSRSPLRPWPIGSSANTRWASCIRGRCRQAAAVRRIGVEARWCSSPAMPTRCKTCVARPRVTPGPATAVG